MSDDANLFEHDMHRRAHEIIRDLRRDGYPDEIQATILCGALTLLLAKTADDMDHLLDGIATTKETIEQGAKMWFEEKKKGEGK